MANVVMNVEFDTDCYAEFEALLKRKVASAQGPFFKTNGNDKLFDIFLEGLPEDRRQHYNCNCCRKFMEQYGGLINIDSEGIASSILWTNPISEFPEFFQKAVESCQRKVFFSRTVGVFLNSEKVWGTPQSGGWSHFSGRPLVVLEDGVKTIRQVAAEKSEDFRILLSSLKTYPKDAVAQVLRILQSGSISRSEIAIGIAEWFAELHESFNQAKSKFSKENIVWLAVVSAPPGYAHINSGMISTLLKGVITRTPIDEIIRKWESMVDPLRYMRPTADLKKGTIDLAEKIVEKLKTSGSLERRFARFDEIISVWNPSNNIKKEKTAGKKIFDHLKEKLGTTIAPVDLPEQKITWMKFYQKILPNAEKIEMCVTNQRYPFFSLITAVNEDSPPILQWDDNDLRNPFSWYFYDGGSIPKDWNLPNSFSNWVQVNAVCLMPPHWNGSNKFSHQMQGAMFILEGCKDLQKRSIPKGGGFFPSMLRSEYHSIRSVMEAFSLSAPIAGFEESNANGICYQKNENCEQTMSIRVKTSTSGELMDRYTINRWE